MPNEGRVQLDGINVGSAFNGAGVSGFAYDTSNAAEMQVTLSGGLGEAEVGAANVNIVPRTGGNNFSGSAFFSTAGEWSQGNNLDDELRSFGITEPAALIKAWDVNGAVRRADQAGPPVVLRQRAQLRPARRDCRPLRERQRRRCRRAGTMSRTASIQARNATAQQVYSVRLTGQATQKDKLGFYIDQQYVCTGSSLTIGGGGCRERGVDWVALGGALQLAGEHHDLCRQRAASASSRRRGRGRRPAACCSTPATRPISAAGAGWSRQARATNLTPVTEQSARACTAARRASAAGPTARWCRSPNFTYRGLDNFFDNKQSPHNWRANVSYVTGAHNMKFGYQGNYYIEETHDFANDTQLTYTLQRRLSRPIRTVRPVGIASRRGRRATAPPRTPSSRRTSGRSKRFTRAGRGSLRPGLELVPGRAQRRAAGLPIQCCADHLPAVGWRDRLQRHHARAGGGVGRVRQRQDRA